MPRIKSINHLAVLVSDMDAALAFWRDGLGMDLSRLRHAPEEQARIAFLPVGEAEIELVLPITSDSGIAKFLAKRGPGMHHICLEVDDLDGMIGQLKSRGIRLINEQARIASDGVRYAFVHPDSAGGVLVELYEP